jgi:hypothetical protein
MIDIYYASHHTRHHIQRGDENLNKVN